jgi:hypothetical protein
MDNFPSPDGTIDASSDDALLASLRRVAADVDPVPESVLAAARAAILTRDLDSQLAALVADSDAASPELEFEQVRSAVAGRLLSFEGAGVQVDVEVTAGSRGLSLMGTVSGAGVSDCVLEGADGGRRELRLDPLGRFMVEAVPAGPARLRCTSAAGSGVITAWVRL